MSQKQFDSPEDQINYAMNLIMNAYESKSEYLESEIRRLNEDFEKGYTNINTEKENLELTLEKLMKENKVLSEKIESLLEDNKKLENFKSSILTSINHNNNNNSNINNNHIINSSNEMIPPKYGGNSVTSNTHNNYIVNALNIKNSSRSNSNKIKNNEHIKQSSFNSSNQNIKQKENQNENRIEMLIERLNESINNRIYPSASSIELTDDNDNLRSYDMKREYKINKTVEDLKSKNVNNSSRTNLSGGNLSESGRNTPSYGSNSNETKFENKFKNEQNLKSKEQYIKLTKGKKPIEIDSLSKEESNEYYENNDTQGNNTNREQKSDQYVMSSKFFSDCRLILKQEDYNKLIETLRLCNNNKIDKFEAFRRIEQILKGQNNLLRDFKYIFPTN